MWLACYSQEEIAEAVGITREAVTKEIETLGNFESAFKITQSLANHTDGDFTPPLYNLWTFAKRADGDVALHAIARLDAWLF